MNDEDDSRARPVLVGLAALVGVAVLIGAVVSAFALGLADVTGVSDGEPVDAATSAESSLYLPSPSAEKPSATKPSATEPSATQPSATNEPSTPSESASSSPSPKPTEPTEPTEPSKSETTKKKPVRRPITLTAAPSRVPTFGRINLDGSYRGAEGRTLQVQRFEGGWVDFPTTASVEGGVFSTYVASGQGGPNRFRVVDESTGQTSGAVTVDVGGR